MGQGAPPHDGARSARKGDEMTKRIEAFEVVDHGVDYSSYFDGCGGKEVAAAINVALANADLTGLEGLGFEVKP